MLSCEDRPVASPSIVLREEFDDWALLFDPDTGKSFGANPVSVFVWQRLDGEHSISDIAAELKSDCDGVPDDVSEHVMEFVSALVENGLAGSSV